MVAIAVLGCGRIGQVHAQTITGLKGVTLAAVSDAMPAAAQALSDSTGALPAAPRISLRTQASTVL